jgi:hypothetical protein
MRKTILAVVMSALCIGTVAVALPAQAVAGHAGAAAAPAFTGGIIARPAAASAVVALAAPSGCPGGDVCFYYQGNGGNLCGYTVGNSTNLHGLPPYGNDCSDIGPSGSIYNNGDPCHGCQDVQLYFYSGYQGAWYCLQMGNYLLYIEKDHFYGGGSGASGFGQTLAFGPQPPYAPGPGGVESVRWTSC